MEGIINCQHCSSEIDLLNTYTSEKSEEICGDCWTKEYDKFKVNEQIERLNLIIGRAEKQIKEAKEEIEELKQ